jgi:N-acetyl-anhydromuramyl-L-alanine amidase AmpD
VNFLRLRPAAGRTWGPRQHTPIDTIVVHVTEGSFEGTLAWFETDAQASAHYVIAKDGRICPCVNEGFAAWHAGNKQVNLRSIGIEIEGKTDELDMPPAQLQALADLIVFIRQRNPMIPLDRAHILGHCEVPDPTHLGLFGGAGHHTDPGHTFPWSELWDRITPPNS